MVRPSQGISLRVSLTARCQLRCTYCAPGGCLAADETAPLSSDEIVRFVRALGGHFPIAKVHLTGGEPLLRPDVVNLVQRLGDLDLPDLALTTNGQRLGELAGPLQRVGLRRLNVSLDSIREDTYSTITQGGEVKPVMEGIVQARAHGLAVKTNTVVLRGINDAEVVHIAWWSLRHGCEARFLELMPIGPAAGRFPEQYVASSEVRRRLGEAFDLRPLSGRVGLTARRFVARDGHGLSGIVGFISACSAPFCRGCRRLRLSASGQLVGCLARGLGPDVGLLLRRGDASADHELVDAAWTALGLKRVRGSFTTRNLMIQTGG
ncbi:MAG: radical SAM protein [Planctomycetes bacterium]|nr:radical SAM protein [Planctomycetota bacterium]